MTLWSASRGGLAAGWLPFGGGYGDQPAWLMAAFAACDAADQALREADKGRGDDP